MIVVGRIGVVGNGGMREAMCIVPGITVMMMMTGVGQHMGGHRQRKCRAESHGRRQRPDQRSGARQLFSQAKKHRWLRPSTSTRAVTRFACNSKALPRVFSLGRSGPFHHSHSNEAGRCSGGCGKNQPRRCSCSFSRSITRSWSGSHSPGPRPHDVSGTRWISASAVRRGAERQNPVSPSRTLRGYVTLVPCLQPQVEYKYKFYQY